MQMMNAPTTIPRPTGTADVESERGVISNLLNSYDRDELTARLNRCEGVGLDHFTDQRLRGIWGEVKMAAHREGEVNLIEIGDKTDAPLADLIALQNEQPTTAHFGTMLRRLGWAAAKRGMALEASQIMEGCHSLDQDPVAVLERVERLRTLATSKSQADDMKASLLSGEELSGLKIISRETYLGGWLREGSLGYVYGPRGLGKTWFSLGLSRAIAEGSAFGPWRAMHPRRVLYVDGEMPLDTMQERDNALRTSTAPIHFLNHERYFEKTGKAFNLTQPDTQRSLSKLLIETKTQVVVLDNLSCLFSGVAENDADAWEKVLPWLLSLRRHRIAVIIVHHSGRAGTHMRGTSRREDAATWVVRLTEPSTGNDIDGARFLAVFTKNRDGSGDETQPIELTFLRGSTGKAEVSFKRMSPLDELRQWLRDGVVSCSDLAEAMGISKPRVSKLAAMAIKAGWLKKNGREYELIESSTA